MTDRQTSLTDSATDLPMNLTDCETDLPKNLTDCVTGPPIPLAASYWTAASSDRAASAMTAAASGHDRRGDAPGQISAGGGSQ